MASEDDITMWISQLAKGDADAAEVIWQQYFTQLVRYARRKLADMPRRSFDEEDVAISAMNSFFKAMEAGRFEKVEDREDLWKLLLTITARKACAQHRRSLRGKRGGGLVRGESAFVGAAGDVGRDCGIGQVLGREPTPELSAAILDNTRQLLDRLDDDKARQIVLMRLQGYRIGEIAEHLGCVRRTVERKLDLVRRKWREEELV